MSLLSYFQLSLFEISFIILTVFIASIIRGFNGFGFSATCISLISFILPTIEIVPIILILEVLVSVFMIPYIWSNIDWKFVLQILIGIMMGTPIGLYLLKFLSSSITHLSICGIVIFFVILQIRGYSNKKINNLPVKILTGSISGVVNGLGTLGGMPVSLFLLVTRVKPIIIRGSLAAIFFLTDIYAFGLSYLGGIVDLTVIYRTLILIPILPLGVFIGNKLFVKSKEETYRKYVFYFLVIISIIGIFKVINNFY